MIRKILSRLFLRQSRKQIIEDPRFRQDEVGTKLVTNFQPRMNLGERRFLEEASRESSLHQEKREEVMRSREEKMGQRYVSERTTPIEGEILGPSESKSE